MRLERCNSIWKPHIKITAKNAKLIQTMEHRSGTQNWRECVKNAGKILGKHEKTRLTRTL